VPFDEVERSHPPATRSNFVPMSLRMNHLRAEKYAEARRRGYSLISYVSSRATTWPGFECGDNCFILEDNTIQPFVRIGNDVVMWSGNHIGHHSTIEDHVMITSQVVVSGCCTIGQYCFFGVNAAVRDETTVAHDTLVGMGVTIQQDTQAFEVYRADAVAPARVRSDRIRSLSHKSGVTAPA
jgi:UDP-3-O-[3-hydroxymyristoyl] glucosamine N-acyltransferase